MPWDTLLALVVPGINQLWGENKESMRPLFIIKNGHIISNVVLLLNIWFLLHQILINRYLLAKIMTCVTLRLQGPSCLAQNPNLIFLYDYMTGKSSDMQVKIVKNLNKFISPILVQHFNYLTKIGKFPDDLKIGRTTKIYKKYNTELLENYEPISTLPIFGKKFEKIMYRILYSFFVSQNLQNISNYSINHIKNSLNVHHVQAIHIQ